MFWLLRDIPGPAYLNNSLTRALSRSDFPRALIRLACAPSIACAIAGLKSAVDFESRKKIVVRMKLFAHLYDLRRFYVLYAGIERSATFVARVGEANAGLPLFAVLLGNRILKS